MKKNVLLKMTAITFFMVVAIVFGTAPMPDNTLRVWGAENLPDAVDGRITLSEDVTLSSGWEISDNSVTLDTNGHTLTVNGTVKVGSDGNGMLTVQGDGALIITGAEGDHNGNVTLDGGSFRASGVNTICFDTLTIADGRIYRDDGSSVNYYTGELTEDVLSALNGKTLSVAADMHTVSIDGITKGTLELTDGVHTTVSASPVAIARKNDTVTLTATPDASYKLDSVTVAKTGDGSITVAAGGTGNTRSFTMPDYDVTVSAAFTQIPVSYISYFNDPGNPVAETKTIPSESVEGYTLLTGKETELARGYYVAEGTLSYPNGLTILDGDDPGTENGVTLILKDGCCLTVGSESSDYGLKYEGSGALNIHGQSHGENAGKMIAVGKKGIISNEGLRICSCNISASGSEGEGVHADDFHIYGGTMNAGSAGSNACAIFSEWNVMIYESKVTATATGRGTDCKAYALYIKDSDFDITRSTLTAEAGVPEGQTAACALYGDYKENGSVFRIEDSTISVDGHSGVGMCNMSSSGSMIIKGGNITVKGSSGGIKADTVYIYPAKDSDSFTVSSYVSASDDVRIPTVLITSYDSVEKIKALKDRNAAGDGRRYGYIMTPEELSYIRGRTLVPSGGNIGLWWTGTGELKVDRPDASDNETVTVTATPGAQKMLSSLKVTDTGGREIKTVKAGDNKWNFKMPSGYDVKVTAEFRECGRVVYVNEEGQKVTSDPVPFLTGNETEIDPGWYAVNRDMTFPGQLKLKGDVNLILMDGCTATVPSNENHYDYAVDGKDKDLLFQDIYHSLNVYGQEKQTGSLNCEAGIQAGQLNIYGGRVTASEIEGGFNIERSVVFANENLSVFRGALTATANNDSNNCETAISVVGSVSINGGTVNATGPSSGCGIRAGGDISLGYTGSSDSITASKWEVADGHNLRVKDGQTFICDGSLYSGTLSGEEISGIAGKPLYPVYRVRIAGGIEHGTVNASPEYYRQNDFASLTAANKTVTLTLTPDAGYAPVNVKYNDGSDHAVTLVDEECSFTMPAKDVTVSATFLKTLAYSNVTIDDIGDQTYSGNGIMPAVTIRDGDTELTIDVDYTVAYSNNINAASKDAENAPTVTITGKDRYTGQRKVSFTINKAAVSFNAPTAKENMKYTGSEQVLVMAGTATGGTMYYAVTDSKTVSAPDFDGTSGSSGRKWSTEVPEKTDAGNYKVWYMVKGDLNHLDSEIRSISAGIAKADFEKTKAEGRARFGTFGMLDLKEYLAPLSEDGSYAVRKIEDTAQTLSVNAALSGTKLSWTFKDNKELVGQKAKVIVSVNNAVNYNDYDLEVTLTVNDCSHPSTTLKNVLAGTCTTEGYSGDVYCSVCGAFMEWGKVTDKDPDNHEFDFTNGTVKREPTLLQPGIHTYTCIRCHKATVDREDIPCLPDEKGRDLDDLREDVKNLSGNNIPVVEEKELSDGSREETVKIGGDEVSKIITDPESGSETVQSKIWVGGLQSGYTYTGSVIKPSFHVYDGTRKLTEKNDYSVTYKNNKDAGTATIRLRFTGSFKGTAEQIISFTIVPAVLGKDIVVHDAAAAATNKDQKPMPVFTWASTGKTVSSKFFTVTYDGAESVKEEGVYTATVTADNKNFDGTATAKVRLVGKNGALLSKAKVIFKPKSYDYTGSEIIPAKGSYTLKLSGKTLNEGTDYKIKEIKNNINPGTATLIFEGVGTGEGSPAGTKTATFKITGSRKLTEAGEGSDFTYIFSESAPFAKNGAKPSVTVMDKGVTLKEGKDYSLSYDKNKALTNGNKTAVIEVKGKGNYKGSVKLYFAITKQSLKAKEITLEAEDQFTTKTRLKKASVIVIDSDGKKLKAGTDYTVGTPDTSAPGNTDESGEAFVMVTGKGNYRDDESVKVSFRYLSTRASNINIAKAMKKIDDKTYTGSYVRLAGTDFKDVLYTGKKDSPVYLEYGKDFSVSGYKDNVKKGVAKVTLKGAGSFAGTKTLSFKIKQKKGDFKGSLVGDNWK
ncbi:MAG: hypothetical protein J5829_02255 [Lachnospiraceae bacterium]|nr:hypothetical protein [Lachnospiraceae bacterium]